MGLIIIAWFNSIILSLWTNWEILFLGLFFIDEYKEPVRTLQTKHLAFLSEGGKRPCANYVGKCIGLSVWPIL